MEAQYIEIDKNGNKYYYKDRELTILHRTNGHAVEWSDGTKYWYIDGVRHRTDGPAVEWSDGTMSWYINDEYLTEEKFNEITSPEIVLTMDEIAAKLGVDVSKLKIVKEH